MKKAVDVIMKNWIAISVLILLTAFLVWSQIRIRGEFAVGSEWLIIAASIAGWAIYKNENE